MKRGITVLVSLSALVTVAYFTASKWAIRHETPTFYDQRAVTARSRWMLPYGATRKCRRTPA